MKARFLIENPGEVEFTLKMTMTAKEWEELRDQLVQKWPSGELNRAITSALTSILKVHYGEQPTVL